jgi:hypothetical protein
MELEGVCHFWSETGTEGGYWAFRDKRYIHPPDKDHPSGRWEYGGLWVLTEGDRITIYDKDDPKKVVWEGGVKLRNHPVFSEHAHGLWIHADQEGIDRKTWALWFLKEYPAKYTPGPNQNRHPA